MPLKFPLLVRNSVKATGFWRDNHLILREFKYFPHIAVLAIIFALLAAAFEGFGLGFLLVFLQSLIGSNEQPFQTGVHWFDSWFLGVNASELSRLYRISALILLSTWIRAAFRYLTDVSVEIVQSRLADRLRKRIFEQFQAVSVGYFAQKRAGELMNYFTEIARLRRAFGIIAFNISKGLTILVYALILFRLSWPLTITVAALFSLLAVGLSTLNRRLRETSFAVSQMSGQFMAIALEFISGIRTVQAFAAQDFERKRFYRASSAIEQASVKTVLRLALARPLAEGAATTILVGIVIVAFVVFVSQGILEIASLLTFLFVLFRMVPAIHEITSSSARISSFHGALESLKTVLRTDDKPYLKNGAKPFLGLQRAIAFVTVDFGYDPDNLVLQGISLTIDQGKMTAIVGASGAGKSTLVDLIPRFYDPTHGQVRLDGTDLREFEIQSVRRKIAIVSQDTFIFNASVWENIAYGLKGVNEAAIREAAHLAHALEFIVELPDGFETQLGDRGVRLSGGQRQRIAIARALLRDPDILILDEATSALDSVSERLIQESLDQLTVGRTVIAIAHRLSTIIRADQVIVLEQGRIVEQGGYQELLARRGALWRYHKMQYEPA